MNIFYIAANPLLFFLIIWFSAISINALNLSRFQSAFLPETKVIIYGSAFFILIGWCFSYFLLRAIFGSPRSSLSSYKVVSKSEFNFRVRTAQVLVVVGVLAFALKVYLVGYVPMLADNKTEAYNNFNWGGPPVISIFFQIIGYCGLYIVILKLLNGRRLNVLDFLPFVLMLFLDFLRGARGPIVTVFIMLALVLILFGKIRLSRIVIPMIALYVLVILMGTLRMDDFESFVKGAGGLDIDVRWYDQFWIWPYLYIAMSVENIDFLVRNYTDYQYGFQTFYAFFSLTGLKNIISTGFDLSPDSSSGNYISTFNLATYIEPFYKDYGVYGCLFLPFLLGGWMSLFYFFRYRSASWFFGYVLVLASAFFCFFYNQFWIVKNIFFLVLLVGLSLIVNASRKMVKKNEY